MTHENTKICVLLPVWGRDFIERFLSISLPTLLASGNIPALAQAHHTRFVILTKASCIDMFEKNTGFQKLKTLCAVEFLSIDDLIVEPVLYSATITLAYERAIHETGKQMLETYFILLTSDFVMADGSFEGLLRYIRKEYSVIFAGNFKVIQEDFEPPILAQFDAMTHSISIKPRELLKYGFPCLHPIDVINLFKETNSHNYLAYRFFFRLNKQIMAGRAYLLHPLCIRPEKTDYQINASVDYSFVPEMCPSGNTAVINDSDDYLMIEAQPRERELNFIHPGKYKLNKLISGLADWTTQQHRDNAKHSVFYHEKDIAPEEKKLIEDELEKFINTLSTGLKKYKVHPYSGHHYWVGTMKAFHAQKTLLQRSQKMDWHDLSKYKDTSTIYKKAIYYFAGVFPQVYPWHFRYYDSRSLMRALQTSITPEKKERTIALYTSNLPIFVKYCNWFKKTLKLNNHLNINSWENEPNKLCELLSKSNEKHFEQSLIMATLNSFEMIPALLKIVSSTLNAHKKIFILIPNEKNTVSNNVFDFKKECINKLALIANQPYKIKDIIALHNNFIFYHFALIEKIRNYFSYNRQLKRLFLVIFALLSVPASLIRNCLPIANQFKQTHCTHVLLTLESE